MQSEGVYPSASIKEYLNVKRSTKNKCCLILFCIYMLVLLMITGLAFFYGNYSNVGLFINPVSNTKCPALYNPTSSSCVASCPSPLIPYLQKICVPTSYTGSQQSAELSSQISMYNFKSSFVTVVYGSTGLLACTVVVLAIVLFCSRLLYVYIGTLVFFVLGFAFYLLQTISDSSNGIDQNSIFYADYQGLSGLAYFLLVLYLFLLPVILFSPKKIHLAIKVLIKMRIFFSKTFTVIFFTAAIALVVWGILLTLGFVVIQMISAGTATLSTNSFFYLYTGVSLSNPGLLVFYFIGVYWFFATLISWHKFFVGSSVTLWYFQEGEKIYPVKRGLKRSWYHLGTAAIDGLLLPIAWGVEFLQIAVRFEEKAERVNSKQKEVKEREEVTEIKEQAQKEQAHGQEEKLQEGNGSCNSLRSCIIKSIYSRVNRNCPAAAVLTNQDYKEGCRMAAQIFAMNNHIFSNIGGTMTIFMGLFTTLAWTITAYFMLYSNLYGKTFPPSVSSIGLPMLLMGSIGLVVGQLMGNVFTAGLDSLLFCFLLEKRERKAEGVKTGKNNQIRDLLETCYYEQDAERVVEMYEETSDSDEE